MPQFIIKQTYWVYYLALFRLIFSYSNSHENKNIFNWIFSVKLFQIFQFFLTNFSQSSFSLSFQIFSWIGVFQAKLNYYLFLRKISRINGQSSFLLKFFAIEFFLLDFSHRIIFSEILFFSSAFFIVERNFFRH